MYKVTLLLALLLTACAMGPDYTRPKVSAPESFRMAGKEGESIANLPWWELLKDEELQKLVRIALTENKDLMAAVASVEEFQARLFIARMDFAPQARATANAPSLGRQTIVNIPGFPPGPRGPHVPPHSPCGPAPRNQAPRKESLAHNS